MIQLDEVEKVALARVIVEADGALKARQRIIRDVILRHGGDPEKVVLEVVDIRTGLAELRERDPSPVVGPQVQPRLIEPSAAMVAKVAGKAEPLYPAKRAK